MRTLALVSTAQLPIAAKEYRLYKLRQLISSWTKNWTRTCQRIQVTRRLSLRHDVIITVHCLESLLQQLQPLHGRQHVSIITQSGPKSKPLASELHQILIDFSTFFHWHPQQQICNNVITKEPFKSQTCCYTTLWNINIGQWIGLLIFHKVVN